MFGKSYSAKSLSLASEALRLVDEEISDDLNNFSPDEIPRDSAWQIHQFSDLFSSDRSQAAQKRVAFNNGLMTAVAEHFFDGESKDLNKFVKLAAQKGVLGGKRAAKFLGKTEQKYPAEFAIGVSYAEGFIKRHIESAESDEKVTQDTKKELAENDAMLELDFFPPYVDWEDSDHKRWSSSVKAFCDIKRAVIDTAKRRSDFYRKWVKEEIEIIDRIQEMNLKYSQELNGEKVWASSSYDEYRLPCLELQKKFLSKLNSFITALNQSGFDFKLTVDDEAEYEWGLMGLIREETKQYENQDQRVSMENFLRSEKDGCSMIFLSLQCEHGLRDWVSTYVLVQPQPEEIKLGGLTWYRAPLNIWSEGNAAASGSRRSVPFSEEGNVYADSLLEDYYPEFKTIRASTEASFPRSPPSLSFIFYFEACLDNFVLEEVPFDKFEFFSQDIAELLPGRMDGSNPNFSLRQALLRYVESPKDYDNKMYKIFNAYYEETQKRP